MKRAFVLFVVAMLYCNFTLAQEADPDPNLLWKTENYYNSFVIHPNGNIIASKGLAVTELNGSTGEIIREFPFYFEFYALSKDGKYLAGGIDGLILIDYETGEVVKKLDVQGSSRVVFMPDNERLLIKTSYAESEMQFCLYNYITEKKSFFGIGSNIGIWSFTISPDSKFLAIGGFIFNQAGENKTTLMLYDALTWQPIRNLATFDEDNEVRSIKFSPDSRLVGFGVDPSRLYIYDTMDFLLRKIFSPQDGVETGAYSFCFITNSSIAYGDVIDFDNQNYFLKIEDIELNEIIHRNDNLSAEAMEFEFQKQIWLIKYRAQIYAFDYTKIISGIEDSSESTTPYSVVYESNTLSIRNFISNSLQLTGQIMNMNGKIIRHIELNPSAGDIRIPVKLISGTYFLHIKDGSKEYVAKFLVVE